MADAEDRAQALRDAAARAFAKPFDAVLEIAVDGAAPFFVDGRADPPAVGEKPPKGGKPACALSGAEDVMTRVLDGERALESAYVSGRLAISGDMSVMARLTLDPSR